MTGSVRAVMRHLVDLAAQARGRPAPYRVRLDTEGQALLDSVRDLDRIGTWGASEFGDAYTRLISAEQRTEHGVYYTPAPLADAMAYAALGLADRHQVRVYDPACGCGVFLESAACMLARRDWGIPSHLLSSAIYGTDIDPIAVEVARAVLWLRSDGSRPIDFLDRNIVCADPLAGEAPPRLGANPGSLVVLGNPPYRERAKGTAPWVEAPRRRGEPVSERPSMDEFRTPGGRAAGFHLASLAMFFWRWAAWRVFEHRPGNGVVAFVAPASLLDGLSFAGARIHLRALADEGWLIHLSPEGSRPPAPTRVFPEVGLPLAVYILARYGDGDPTVQADLSYLAVTGAAEEKLRLVRAACADIARRGAPQRMGVAA